MGGSFPSCCFLAVAPNILDFWHGLAHRGEIKGPWCCVILMCGSGMGEGSPCRVQEPTGVCEQCPVGYRREEASPWRNRLYDWSYSSQPVHPSSCLHPALPGPSSALGQLHHKGTHSSCPPSGGAHGAELRQRELVQSSLRMALDLPKLLVRQEELAGLSWHMTQQPLMSGRGVTQALGE